MAEIPAMRAHLVKPIIAASLDAIVCADEQGNIILWNKAAERMFGYTEAEALAQPLTMLFSEENRAAHEAGIRHFLETGKGKLIGKITETMGLKKDGSAFPKEMSLAAEKAEGKWLFTAILRDISARRQAEAELRASEARFRTLVEHSPDAIFLIDAEGRFVDASQHTCDSLGYAREELMRLSVSDIDRDFPPEKFKAFQASLESGRPIIIEGTHVRKDGSTFPAEIHVSVFELGGKRIDLAIARDVSSRRQAEKTFRALVESMGGRIGQELSDVIVSNLCEWLDVECAIIGEIVNDGRVRTLAMRLDGKPVAGYEYGLPGTPCENVVAKGYCEYLEGVSGLFPDDKALADMRAEGYAGTPIRGREGNAIGILCAISRSPLSLPPNTKDVFEIVAARLGAEIERRRVEGQLKQRLAEVEEARQSMLLMLEDVNETKIHIEHIKQEWVATFDAVAQPIFLHDDRGRIIRANRAYAEKAGMAVEACIGRLYWQTFPKSDARLHSCEQAEIAGEAVEELTTDDGAVYLVHSYAMEEDGGISVHWMQNISERKEYERKLRQNLEGTIRAVSRSVEARDPYTAGHQARVAKLACAIAREMGLAAEQIEGIRWGGMIHDIGKIHLPAEILSKPAKLTKLEYSLVQAHPQVGFDILKGIEFPCPVADIAHQHHERLDGSGYPQGLKGDKICLEAKIVAIADVVEAMSSHRPYRPSLGIYKALAEIKRGRGRQYDPQAADACITLFREKKFSFD